MNIITTKITDIKANPNNPRIIKDHKFKKLVASIKEFPEMLALRPIVVNNDMIVLGGNMRLRACKEAGLKEVPVIMASDLSEAQQKEFIIKDNLGSGEWDWDNLANEWNDNNLNEWGLIQWDIPEYQPTLEPQTNYKEVTDNDVMKKARELADKFIQESLEADILCPSCGHEFKVQL